MTASAYHVIPKEIESHILRYNKLLDTDVYINNPHWQSSRIIIILCNYDIAIRASWETKKERLSHRKKYIEAFVWGLSLLWLNALLSMSFFVAFFVDSLPLLKWCTCWMAPIKIHNIAMVGILPDDTMSKLSKTWQSLAI